MKNFFLSMYLHYKITFLCLDNLLGSQDLQKVSQNINSTNNKSRHLLLIKYRKV